MSRKENIDTPPFYLRKITYRYDLYVEDHAFTRTYLI